MDAATKSEASAQLAALRDKFIALAGSGYARSATGVDAVAGVQPKLMVEPGTEQELAEILRLSNDAGLAVIPRGGGTKLAWGNSPARADLIVSTSRLTKIIEHAWADLTVSVEAGCTFHKLQETLAQHRQRLALDPLWPRKATIGGVLSTNDSGALRLRFGALRDLIIGVTIALPDGTLASSGGKVVKNVAGYDLPKLVTGAFGTPDKSPKSRPQSGVHVKIFGRFLTPKKPPSPKSALFPPTSHILSNSSAAPPTLRTSVGNP